MLRHGRWVRALGMVWATLLVVSPAASAFGDAQYAREQAGAPAHVEATTSSECARAHPPDCGLCRHLTTTAVATGAATALPPTVARRVVADDIARHQPGVTIARWGRAPPLS